MVFFIESTTIKQLLWDSNSTGYCNNKNWKNLTELFDNFGVVQFSGDPTSLSNLRQSSEVLNDLLKSSGILRYLQTSPLE